MRPEARVWRKATRKAARHLPGGTGRRHGLSEHTVAARLAREERVRAARVLYAPWSPA